MIEERAAIQSGSRADVPALYEAAAEACDLLAAERGSYPRAAAAARDVLEAVTPKRRRALLRTVDALEARLPALDDKGRKAVLLGLALRLDDRSLERLARSRKRPTLAAPEGS